MCARKKEIYRCMKRYEALSKLSDLLYSKGGYWGIFRENDIYVISNYVSKKEKVIMDGWGAF